MANFRMRRLCQPPSQSILQAHLPQLLCQKYAGTESSIPVYIMTSHHLGANRIWKLGHERELTSEIIFNALLPSFLLFLFLLFFSFFFLFSDFLLFLSSFCLVHFSFFLSITVSKSFFFHFHLSYIENRIQFVLIHIRT